MKNPQKELNKLEKGVFLKNAKFLSGSTIAAFIFELITLIKKHVFRL